MTKGDNESSKDFEERFQLSYKRAHNYTPDEDSWKLVLLRRVREYLMETLNLLVNGYIYHLDYATIKQILKNHSRENKKKGGYGRSMLSDFSSPSVLTKNEIGGMLEDMKT